jgi:hypothetical protein
MSREKYPHYYKHCPYEYVDPYRIMELFGVTDQAIGHAIKKLLVAGGRGHKDIEKDIKEAIVTLTRRVEMWEEDKPVEKHTVDDIYEKHNWEEGVDFTEDRFGYFNFTKSPKLENWPDTSDPVIWAKEFCKDNPEVDVAAAILWFSYALKKGKENELRSKDETPSYKINSVSYGTNTWDISNETDSMIEFGPRDSLGPFPKPVERIPELTDNQKQVIMDRIKRLNNGEKHEIK